MLSAFFFCSRSLLSPSHHFSTALLLRPNLGLPWPPRFFLGLRLQCEDGRQRNLANSNNADSEQTSHGYQQNSLDDQGARSDPDHPTGKHLAADNATRAKENLLAFISKATGVASIVSDTEEEESKSSSGRLERREKALVSFNQTESPVKIRYVRYGDSFLLGIDGTVQLVKKIQKRITDFLQNELKLEAESRFTHVEAGKVNFLGTVIQAVPWRTNTKSSKALEKRRRVKHRLRQIAAQRRFSIQTRIENLGKHILARQLKRGKTETGSYREAGRRLAETLKLAGVTAESDPLREAAQDIQQKSREILRSVGWSNMPPDVQEAFLRLDESLGSWMTSFEIPKGGREIETRRVVEGARSDVDAGHWEDGKPAKRFVIKILAPVNILILRLRSRGIIAEKKALPTHVGRLSNLDDEEIVNWFSSVAKGLLTYYRCCDNFDEVKAIVDYHIRWSAIFTLAFKHKSSARKIIQKVSKDLQLVDSEGRIIAKYPNSLEIKTMKRGFFERNPLNKDEADKILDGALIRYCKGDEKTDRDTFL